MATVVLQHVCHACLGVCELPYIFFDKIAASFLEIERKCLKRKVVNNRKRKIRK